MALSPSSTLCRSSFMRAWRVAARNNSVSLGSSSMCKTAVSGSRAAWAPPEPPRDLEEFDRDPIRFRISDIRRTTACAHSERSKPLPTSAILHRTHLWRVVKEKSEVLQAFQVLFVTDETVGVGYKAGVGHPRARRRAHLACPGAVEVCMSSPAVGPSALTR